MQKKKLTLQVEELSVTSFDVETRAAADGTVKAHEDMPPTTDPCYTWNTWCSRCLGTDCC
ncbi:hypothetical protein [Longimicrobium sp.]|uniref:hypothetical protein n=1 Tax=Longimicrobium sp. TaxID=2029185 RepID=UPI003B3BD1C5